MRKNLHHDLLAPSPAQLNITFTLKTPLKPGLCPMFAFPGGLQPLDKSEPLETPPGLELRQISHVLELPFPPRQDSRLPQMIPCPLSMSQDLWSSNRKDKYSF